MRRFLFGVVIASVTTAMPTWAFGGDREIAQAVMAELQHYKTAGKLKGFDLDMQVQDGVVYLEGQVSSRAQRTLVAQAAANAVGVGNLVNKIIVVESSNPEPAAASMPSASRAGQNTGASRQASGSSSRRTVEVDSKSTARSTALQQVAKPLPLTTQTTQTVQTASSKPIARPEMTDTAVTDLVIARLQDLKASGQLRGFELDVSTTNGDLWLKGQVSSHEQKSMVLDAARRVRGVHRVVDDMVVATPGDVRTASTGGFAPAAGQPAPVPHVAPMIPQGSSMPTGQMQTMPQAFAPSALASGPVHGDYVAGAPVPMHAAAVSYGVGAPRYDQPNMPSYAWPSYAAYPNYSAVTYPKQYSPSAWPYIGPFYPYPQVPLGWRKVALEWDDGLWYLDFTSKSH